MTDWPVKCVTYRYCTTGHKSATEKVLCHFSHFTPSKHLSFTGKSGGFLSGFFTQILRVFIVYAVMSIRNVQKKTELLLWRLYCSFYSILSTVPFKVVPSTGDTPFPTFLPLLECFLERTFCDGEQFSCRVFLNLLYGLETTSFKVFLNLGNRKKSAGAKSGE